MSRESEDLATHIEICALRYKGIEDKFDVVDKRLDAMHNTLEDIRLMLDKRSNSTQTTILTVSGTIIVALIGFLGFLLTHIK